MVKDRQERRDLQEIHRRQKKRESLLETLESIIVAFVLAFIFRAFLVEAFVIPTGSMAPTLYGEHVELECRDCGYGFAAGVEERPGNRRAVPPTAVCPNCGLRQTVPPRSAFSGDRILVQKFLYDFEPPRRWDVLVFRNPNAPSQNYIKRLVGLPSETIELVDGNVTINGRIVQKTDRAQEALWMLVHDTRYGPARRSWSSRWVSAEGPSAAGGAARAAGLAEAGGEQPPAAWQPDGKGFRLAQATASEVWLAYHHEDADGRRVPISDYYAYNALADSRAMGQGGCVVTDLALRGPVTVEDAQAVVVIELGAWKDRFRFELTAKGSGRPSRVLRDGRTLAESIEGVLPVGEPVLVLAANVDHKVMLRVRGRRPLRALAETVTPEGDPVYEPTPITVEERRSLEQVPDGPARVRIGARGGPVRLGYLRLDRDVHYVNETLRTDEPGHATEGHPFALLEDEFFVLGDNSPKSFDCRLWPLDRPVTPRRNLVGKAFFVYWPAAGRRVHGIIPIAPDVTRFRFVH
jgi:signal peptidase I